MCLANGLRSEILLGSFAMQAVKKKKDFFTSQNIPIPQSIVTYFLN